MTGLREKDLGKRYGIDVGIDTTIRVYCRPDVWCSIALSRNEMMFIFQGVIRPKLPSDVWSAAAVDFPQVRAPCGKPRSALIRVVWGGTFNRRSGKNCTTNNYTSRVIIL